MWQEAAETRTAHAIKKKRKRSVVDSLIKILYLFDEDPRAEMDIPINKWPW